MTVIKAIIRQPKPLRATVWKVDEVTPPPKKLPDLLTIYNLAKL